MKECYQIYEDKRTYFLEIDHEQKTFSVGSAKGKKRKNGYRDIDETGYRAQIMRIGVDYECLSNCVTL